MRRSSHLHRRDSVHPCICTSDGLFQLSSSRHSCPLATILDNDSHHQHQHYYCEYFPHPNGGYPVSLMFQRPTLVVSMSISSFGSTDCFPPPPIVEDLDLVKLKYYIYCIFFRTCFLMSKPQLLQSELAASPSCQPGTLPPWLLCLQLNPCCLIIVTSHLSSLIAFIRQLNKGNFLDRDLEF